MSGALTSIDRARAYIAQIPGAISGQAGHNQTFTVACALINGFALSEYDALILLREFNTRCQPPWTERELIHKIQSAIQSSHDKPRGHLLGSIAENRPPAYSSKSRLSAIDPAMMVERFLKGFRCEEVDLWEASPIRPPEDWRKDAIMLVSHLYKPGELINFVTNHATDKDGKARPDGVGKTVERDTLLGRWTAQGMPSSDAGGWLRMNPVDGRGIADANVTAFRFALLEFDGIPLPLQMSLLATLRLPIACILHSAGRSVHAWVRIDADDFEDYRSGEMWTVLERFGADAKNKNPARLSRLPGVIRNLGANGNGKQRLFYLNPNPELKPIYEAR